METKDVKDILYEKRNKLPVNEKSVYKLDTRGNYGRQFKYN